MLLTKWAYISRKDRKDVLKTDSARIHELNMKIIANIFMFDLLATFVHVYFRLEYLTSKRFQ